MKKAFAPAMIYSDITVQTEFWRPSEPRVLGPLDLTLSPEVISNPNTKYESLSLRQGMLFGAFWSFCSVGWIAWVLLVFTWVRSGFFEALFWFGLILFGGAGLFFVILCISVLCEVFKIAEKRSRRDGLIYFGWAFLFNLVFGFAAFMFAMANT